MAQQQLNADTAESRSDNHPTEDWSHPEGPLRHTTGKERNHRDRGIASNTSEWSAHIREDRD